MTNLSQRTETRARRFDIRIGRVNCAGSELNPSTWIARNLKCHAPRAVATNSSTLQQNCRAERIHLNERDQTARRSIASVMNTKCDVDSLCILPSACWRFRAPISLGRAKDTLPYWASSFSERFEPAHENSCGTGRSFPPGLRPPCRRSRPSGPHVQPRRRPADGRASPLVPLLDTGECKPLADRGDLLSLERLR